MLQDYDQRDHDPSDVDYKNEWEGGGSGTKHQSQDDEIHSDGHDSESKARPKQMPLTGMDRLRRLMIPHQEEEDQEPEPHTFYKRKPSDEPQELSGDHSEDDDREMMVKRIRRKHESREEQYDQPKEDEEEEQPQSSRQNPPRRRMFGSNRSQNQHDSFKESQNGSASESNSHSRPPLKPKRSSNKSLVSKHSRDYNDSRNKTGDSSPETQTLSGQTSSRSSKLGRDNSRAEHLQKPTSQLPVKSDYVKKMKMVLKKIFHFYACYGSRCSQKNLKPTQFIKMMFDANIADNNLNQRNLDLMFLQASSKSKTLEYDEFLELLLIVASRKFKKQSGPDAAFKVLLTDYLEPLYVRMLEMTDLGIEDKIMNSPMSIATLLVLKMIAKPLQVAYRHYFTWETSRPLQEKPSQSKVEAELFNFLKDFEICPQMIAKASAHSLFVQILALTDSELTQNTQYPDMSRILGEKLGENFTFYKFVTYLVRLGVYIFSDMNNIPTTRKSTSFTLEEKSYLLLERLDISPGVSKIMHVLQKERLVANGTQSSGSQPYLNGGLGQHRLSISRDSLQKIHRETGAYPNFFPEDEDEGTNKLSRLTKIIQGNKKGKNGNDKTPKTEIDNPEEEFMYIKMAKRGSSKGLFTPAETQVALSTTSTGRSSSNSGLFRRQSSNSKLLNKTPSKLSRVSGSSVNDKENRREGNVSQPTSSKKSDQGKPSQPGDPSFSIDENYEVCGRYCDELNQIFKCYCSLGEPGNYKSLKSKQFMRLMKDAGVVCDNPGSAQDEYPLQTQDVDLIFCTILQGLDPFSKNSHKKVKNLLFGGKQDDNSSRNQSPNKPKNSGLDFTLFLKSLEAVAVWVEGDSEKTQRLSHFIENRLLDLLHRKNQTKPNEVMMKKLESKDYFTGKLMSLLRDKSMIEMLSVVHKALLPLYSIYCDESKLINLKKFLEFMKDFSVFPQLVSQPKLLQLFHELYALFKTKSEHGADLKEEAIDQHLFVEGLTLLALEIDYSQFKLTNAQKLILLLDRMNDSDASKKISRRLGRTISKKFDIVSGVREKFGEHFKF